MPQIGKLFISSFVSDDYNNHHKIARFWHTTMSKIITSTTSDDRHGEILLRRIKSCKPSSETIKYKVR
jgi:hypothetical protein